MNNRCVVKKLVEKLGAHLPSEEVQPIICTFCRRTGKHKRAPGGFCRIGKLETCNGKSHFVSKYSAGDLVLRVHETIADVIPRP